MFWMMLFSCDAITEQYNVAADPSDDTEFIFAVPKGANARKLGKPLQKEGIIDNGDDFVTYIKLSKEDHYLELSELLIQKRLSRHK